ncbi:MAG: ATP-binding protein, partial [Campylobacterota bacterium]
KKSIQERVESVVATINLDLQMQDLTQIQQMNLISQKIKSLNAQDKKEYIFIYALDEAGNIRKIVSLNDKNVDIDIESDFVQQLQKRQTSFSTYEIQNPQTQKSESKLSYFKLMPKYNWIVGSGVYLSDLQKQIQQQSQSYGESLAKSFYITVMQSFAFFLLFASILYYLLQKLLHFIDKNEANLEMQRTKAQNIGRKFETIFSALQDGNIIFEYNSRVITEVNQRVLDMLGFEYAEIVGKDILFLLHDKRILKDLLRDMQKDFIKERSSKFILREISVYGKLDVPIYVDCVLSSFEYEDKMYIAMVMHDVTKRLRYVQELEEVRQRLFRANLELKQRVKNEVEKSRQKDSVMFQQSKLATLGEVINSIAHQWRQPLNRISAVINDLKVKAELGMINNEQISASMDTMSGNIQNMSSKIDRFRNFFAPDSTKRIFEVQKELQSAIEFAQDSYGAQTLQITLHRISSDCMIEGFQNEFRQLVLNIINNSKEAFAMQQLTQKKITITVEKQDRDIVIDIKDCAGGIEEEVLEKVYEPYVTTKDEDGVGMGLFMAKIVVQEHLGGTIEVQNIQGGTLVRLMLPLYNTDKNG